MLEYITPEVMLYLSPIIVFIATIITAKAFKSVFGYWYKKSQGRIDQTHYALVSRVIVIVIYIVGFFAMVSTIPPLKTFAYSMFAGAGVLALIIGFATKDIFSNLLSGIFIGIFEPFRIGDRVLINDNYGMVEDITLRHTVIKTWENKRLIIPNTEITNHAIINYSITDEKILRSVDINISYDSNINKARSIMLEEAKNHPDCLIWSDGKDKKVPVVRVVELGDYYVKLRLYAWAADQGKAYAMGTDLLESIKKKFDKEGIEIPFPYRTIVYKHALEQKEKERLSRLRKLAKTQKEKEAKKLAQERAAKKTASKAAKAKKSHWTGSDKKKLISNKKTKRSIKR